MELQITLPTTSFKNWRPPFSRRTGRKFGIWEELAGISVFNVTVAGNSTGFDRDCLVAGIYTVSEKKGGPLGSMRFAGRRKVSQWYTRRLSDRLYYTRAIPKTVYARNSTVHLSREGQRNCQDKVSRSMHSTTNSEYAKDMKLGTCSINCARSFNASAHLVELAFVVEPDSPPLTLRFEMWTRLRGFFSSAPGNEVLC